MSILKSALWAILTVILSPMFLSEAVADEKNILNAGCYTIENNDLTEEFCIENDALLISEDRIIDRDTFDSGAPATVGL